MRILLITLTLALPALLLGCNASPVQRPRCYPVRGQVLLASGLPLTGGRVEFYQKDSEGGEPVASGEIEKDGTFVVGTYAANDGASPGTYIVTVLPVSYKTGNPKQAVAANLVPKMFTEPETSRLIAVVKEQENVLPPFILR